jgi:hypothetical protein
MKHTTLPTAITPGAFVNPQTGHLVTPGKVLGYRRDGRPIYAIAGGSGEGGDDTGSDDGSTDADQDGTTDQDGDGTKKPDIKGEFDPERHARSLAAAREGEKKAKAEAKAEKERVAAILKAAGLTPDGKTDPAEQLKAAAAERDKATAKARDTAVELAVYKTAGKAGGDPDAVLDSRGFLAQVADLDPDAADFADKVTAAVKAAVKANPKLAAASAGQGPGKQGADHSGGGGQKTKPKTLTDAITAKLGGS